MIKCQITHQSQKTLFLSEEYFMMSLRYWWQHLFFLLPRSTKGQQMMRCSLSILSKYTRDEQQVLDFRIKEHLYLVLIYICIFRFNISFIIIYIEKYNSIHTSIFYFPLAWYKEKSWIWKTETDRQLRGSDLVCLTRDYTK